MQRHAPPRIAYVARCTGVQQLFTDGDRAAGEGGTVQHPPPVAQDGLSKVRLTRVSSRPAWMYWSAVACGLWSRAEFASPGFEPSVAYADVSVGVYQHDRHLVRLGLGLGPGLGLELG